MAHYYSELHEFNRLSYDSKNTSQQPGILIFARMYPIAASEEDITALNEFKELIQKWMDLALIAPRPISIH